jgi:hypothetical protein
MAEVDRLTRLPEANASWPLARESMSVAEMAQVLRKNLGEAARRAQRTMTRPAAYSGWTPRSNEEAVVATGESLLRLGLLSK